MLANLDIDLLRTFVTINETGSFTQTGELLGRTQSAISVQVKRLETQLGKELLQRSGRRIELTEDGEQLLYYARRILAINDDAVSRITAPRVSGKVTLGTCEEFAEHCLADILGPFARSHPDVRLEIVVDYSKTLIEDLKSGAFDIALANRLPGDGVEPSIVREPLVWVAREDFETQPAGSVPLVIGQAPCVWRRFALEALEGVGREWHIVCSSQESKGLHAAVMAGLGVSVFPRSTVLDGMRVLTERDGYPLMPDADVALFRRAGEMSPAAVAFESYVLDYASISQAQDAA